jgi:adenylylsulfate kinase
MRGKVLWFTGLSGAGKTTLAQALRDYLSGSNVLSIVLDGDVLRKGLNADLGFSAADRAENIRRVSELAKFLSNEGITCIVSTISPYAELRANARRIVGEDVFLEIYISAPLSVCEQRDVKGLYRKARANHINGFTGIQDSYEPPSQPDLEINTDIQSVAESLAKLSGWFSEMHNINVRELTV